MKAVLVILAITNGLFAVRGFIVGDLLLVIWNSAACMVSEYHRTGNLPEAPIVS